jgi:ribose 5-phosphate isomerase A
MLPVEVTPFAHEILESFFRELGAEPALRRAKDGSVFITDNANYIYDCRFVGGISDAAQLEHSLRRRAGIVETGLFLGIANFALVADESKVERRERK